MYRIKAWVNITNKYTDKKVPALEAPKSEFKGVNELFEEFLNSENEIETSSHKWIKLGLKCLHIKNC